VPSINVIPWSTRSAPMTGVALGAGLGGGGVDDGRGGLATRHICAAPVWRLAHTSSLRCCAIYRCRSALLGNHLEQDATVTWAVELGQVDALPTS
jgi:hypothetical protein